jgi:hypothetical protein
MGAWRGGVANVTTAPPTPTNAFPAPTDLGSTAQPTSFANHAGNHNAPDGAQSPIASLSVDTAARWAWPSTTHNTTTNADISPIS